MTNLRRFFFVGIIFGIILAAINPLSIHAQDDQKPKTTEEALAQAVVPPRDLSDLAVRLRGVQDIPTPPDTAPQRNLGDVEEFSVQNDMTGVVKVNARLIYINDYLYIWLEEGLMTDEVRVKEAADIFSDSVYGPVREVFGSEWSPGIDGDPRLHILMTDDLGPGIAGYYYSNSQYPRQAIETSNEREMFFVDYGMINYGVPYFISLLSHEFQHMIHWANDSNEESWLNEGLSELSVYVAGYGISDFSPYYLASPGSQLNNWPQNDRGRIYGGGFLFSLYFLERYGIDAVKMLVADDANGMDSVQNTLTAINALDPLTDKAVTGQDFYADWSIANYMNDTSVGDGRYGYQDEAAARLPHASITANYNVPQISLVDQSIEQWSTHYYRLEGGSTEQTLTLTFDGNDTVPLFPISAYSGDYAFWSNRVNQGDARLTRAFDLSNVDAATLNFYTWYAIEDEWDFAYLLVSTDAGATWQIVPTDKTTDRNRHGTSYGMGYTGFSGDWVPQTVDLTPYVGQEILIRFEYVTDDATLEAGFLVDDVSIPEIGYFEDFEGEAEGWNAEGWVKVNNTLKQSFVIHTIMTQADGSHTVTRLLSADEPSHGTWEFIIGGNTTDITIVISPMAAVTTEQAVFSLKTELSE